MKREGMPGKRNLLIIIVFIASIATGCSSFWTPGRGDLKNIDPGESASAGAGELFFFNPGSKAFFSGEELSKPCKISVLRLNEKEVILKYVELSKDDKTGKWVLLPGVKTYTYPVNIDKIEIMEYSFHVLSLQGGVIRYKRIK